MTYNKCLFRPNESFSLMYELEVVTNNVCGARVTTSHYLASLINLPLELEAKSRRTNLHDNNLAEATKLQHRVKMRVLVYLVTAYGLLCIGRAYSCNPSPHTCTIDFLVNSSTTPLVGFQGSSPTCAQIVGSFSLNKPAISSSLLYHIDTTSFLEYDIDIAEYHIPWMSAHDRGWPTFSYGGQAFGGEDGCECEDAFL